MTQMLIHDMIIYKFYLMWIKTSHYIIIAYNLADTHGLVPLSMDLFTVKQMYNSTQ